LNSPTLLLAVWRAVFPDDAFDIDVPDHRGAAAQIVDTALQALTTAVPVAKVTREPRSHGCSRPTRVGDDRFTCV